MKKIFSDAILKSVAPLQAATGDVAGGLRTASGLPPDSRSGALVNIAIVQFEAGDTQGARRTIGAALDIANAITDIKKREMSLHFIVYSQLKVEGVEASLRIANRITDRFWRINSLSIIALHQADDGDIEGALATFNRVEEKYRPNNLSYIAKLQAEAGDVEGARRNMDAALRFARNNPDEHYKSANNLISVAGNQARMGDMTGARKTTEAALRVINSLEKGYRSYPLSTLAGVRILVGDVEGAFATANFFSDNSNRASALRNIAKAQAETGAVEESRRTANGITDNIWKTYALNDISSLLIDKRKEEKQALKKNTQIAAITTPAPVARPKPKPQQTVESAKKYVNQILNKYIPYDTTRQIIFNQGNFIIERNTVASMCSCKSTITANASKMKAGYSISSVDSLDRWMIHLTCNSPGKCFSQKVIEGVSGCSCKNGQDSHAFIFIPKRISDSELAKFKEELKFYLKSVIPAP